MNPIEIDGRRYALVPVDGIEESVAVFDRGVPAVPEVVTAKDFAGMLRDGTSPTTVRRMCKEGVFPAKQLGREWYVRAREAFGLKEPKEG